MKRTISMLLLAALLAGLFTGCAAGEPAATAAAASTVVPVTTAPVDLSTGSIEVENLGIDLGGARLEFQAADMGGHEARLQIWEQLSGYVNGIYNGNVTLTCLQTGDYYEGLRERIDAGTAPDVVTLTLSPRGGCGYGQLAAEGALAPLDGYVSTLLARSYAKVDERYYDGARREGKLYGIIRDQRNHPFEAVLYNKERTDAAGVEIGSWVRLSDLWDEQYALREWIDKNQPEKYNTPISPLYINWQTDSNIVSFADCLGVMYLGYEAVADHEAETEIFNFYDCPEFTAYIKSLNQMVTDRILPQERNEWAERGTWAGDDDAFAGRTVVLWWQRNAEEPAVIPDASGKPRMTWTLARPAVTLDDYFSTTYVMHSVTRDCRDPEAACKLIEILNNDLYVGTTLMLGIEGRDWYRAEDGRAECRMGTDADVFAWDMFCSVSNCILPTNHPADILNLMRETDAKMVFTDNLGFMAEPTAVQDELDAVNAVSEAYLNADMLYSGRQSPAEIDAMAAEFVEALNAAGVDRIREEYQRQLDAWRAGR